MDEFLLQLQDLIAKNKIPQVIKTLLVTLQKCESRNEDSKDEVRSLRNQVILLSSRYNETRDKINSGTMDPILADTAKNQQIAGFLNLISRLPENKEFTDYINHREEEDAWDKALAANTIQAYNSFFTQYPDGKYKDETKRVIAELKNIQKQKENEMKQKAEEEKARRNKEQQDAKERQQASAELQAIRKEKEELLAKKQKAQEELEEIERQRKAALDEEKEQEAVAKNQKVKASEQHQKAQEELERIKKEKEALLEKKRRTEADLQKVEEQRKAAANRERKMDTKKEKQAVDKKQKSKPVAQEAIGAASGIAATTAKKESFFARIFSDKYKLWTLTTIIFAPICGIGMALLLDDRNDEMVWALIFLFPIVFSIIAFKKPFTPRSHSILYLAVASFIPAFIILTLGLRESGTWMLFFALLFFPAAVIVSLILYFKNKATTKDGQQAAATKPMTQQGEAGTSTKVPGARTLEDEDLFSHFFLNPHYRWWTLMPIVSLIIGYIGGVLMFQSGRLISTILLLLVPILYGIISYKFPLRKLGLALLSNFIALFFVILGVKFGSQSIVGGEVPIQEISRMFSYDIFKTIILLLTPILTFFISRSSKNRITI